MIGFIAFLSMGVSMALLWLLVMGNYVVSKGGFSFFSTASGTEIGFVVIGLFLPLFMIVCATSFIYIVIEIKKQQMIFKDWIASLKREFVHHETSIHNLIGEQLHQKNADTNDEECDTRTYPLPFKERSIMTISRNESISKYKDLNLPDDVDLLFKG